MLKVGTRTTPNRTAVFTISHTLEQEATILYTLDGSDPSTQGEQYTSAVEVPMIADVYLRAVLKQGNKTIDTLGIKLSGLGTPSEYDLPEVLLAQEQGNDSDDCRVSITNPEAFSGYEGILFHYTTNGEDPSLDDPYLTNPEDDVIVVRNGTVKIQAVVGNQYSPVASIVIDDLRVNLTSITYVDMD